MSATTTTQEIFSVIDGSLQHYKYGAAICEGDTGNLSKEDFLSRIQTLLQEDGLTLSLEELKKVSNSIVIRYRPSYKSWSGDM